MLLIKYVLMLFLDKDPLTMSSRFFMPFHFSSLGLGGYVDFMSLVLLSLNHLGLDFVWAISYYYLSINYSWTSLTNWEYPLFNDGLNY